MGANYFSCILSGLCIYEKSSTSVVLKIFLCLYPLRSWTWMMKQAYLFAHDFYRAASVPGVVSMAFRSQQRISSILLSICQNYKL